MNASRRPVRLLYVVNIPRFFVSHRLPLALAARDAGYEVHVSTSDNDVENVAAIVGSGLPFHPLPLSQHGTRLNSELGTIWALYRLYRTLQPDIVHQVTIKPILYGGVAARLARVPAVVNAVTGLGYVFVTPGWKAALLRQVAMLAYRFALRYPNSRTIFQNPDDLKLFVERGLVSEAKAVLIKGSGVDVNEFRPQPEAEGVPVVLFAGRLLWQKGIREFVQAAERLREAGVRARFVVAGYPEPSSPSAVPLEQLERWQESGVIEWWGKRTDMPAVFAQSHFVCLPSTYGEGVPKVLIEAAACGRAAVTTDTPGCREIVRNGENGLLVPSGDLDALAGAIERLATDAALRRRMGARGREIAVSEFSLETVVSQTFAVYQELLS